MSSFTDVVSNARFTELPLDTGSGDYHFNRFRIVFGPPRSGIRNATTILWGLLYTNFPNYINSNFATAEWGDYYYNDQKTIHFHGIAKTLGINVAAPHSDWVAIKSFDPNNFTFTVQTLKREFQDTAEDALPGGIGAVVGGIVGGPIGLVIGAEKGAGDNSMHFLAGRRAWRIGEGPVFGLSNNVIVLETIAVERLSALLYRAVDWGIGIESKVPLIWNAFLYNFVNQTGVTPVNQTPKPRWKQYLQATYIQISYDSLTGLKGDPEFMDAYRLYPDILP